MLLKEFIKGGVKHGLRLIREPAYREWCRLVGRYSHFPRHQEQELVVSGMSLRVPDVAPFLSGWYEIFLEDIYRFQCQEHEPVIIDFGANIGLSVIFLKRLFPDAKLFAYEADPYIFRFLEENVSRNVSGSVTLCREAIWTSDGELYFQGDRADGGRIMREKELGSVKVQTTDIRKVLGRFEKIAFLKMDIESAEREVIPAAGELLDRVEKIFVEYHSPVGKGQRLAELLGCLEKAGFRVIVQSIGSAPAPFLADYGKSIFDLQLNFWGRREG